MTPNFAVKTNNAPGLPFWQCFQVYRLHWDTSLYECLYLNTKENP